MFRKIIAVVIIFLLCIEVNAQKIIISGEETSRPLRWADFTGRPDRSTDLFAFTYWNISYQYNAFVFIKDTVKWKINITVELGRNSWKKDDKITDSLLTHEQGHFNIGKLCAIDLQTKLDNTVFFKPNYQDKLAALIRETVDQYKKMELSYDEETNHYKNREQQARWNEFFVTEISRLKKLQQQN